VTRRFVGEVIEEASDVFGTELARVAQVVKPDERAHPVDVGLLGSVAVMPTTRSETDLVE
jgi:hypothetical protein